MGCHRWHYDPFLLSSYWGRAVLRSVRILGLANFCTRYARPLPLACWLSDVVTHLLSGRGVPSLAIGAWQACQRPLIASRCCSTVHVTLRLPSSVLLRLGACIPIPGDVVCGEAAELDLPLSPILVGYISRVYLMLVLIMSCGRTRLSRMVL
jgi:hypothetical protein